MKEDRLLTPVFRMNFPKLFKAVAMNVGDPERFSCMAIWNFEKFTLKDIELWEIILKKLDVESRIRFKRPFDKLPENIKKGIRDYDPNGSLAGMKVGDKYSNLSTKMRPGIVDQNLNTISYKYRNESEVYPGAWFRATIVVFSFDVKVNRGLSLGLRNIQKVADGQKLGRDTEVDAKTGDDFSSNVDDYWKKVGAKNKSDMGSQTTLSKVEDMGRTERETFQEFDF